MLDSQQDVWIIDGVASKGTQSMLLKYSVHRESNKKLSYRLETGRQQCIYL